MREVVWLCFFAVMGLHGCQSAKTAQSEIILWHAYRGGEARALGASVARYNQTKPQRILRVVALPYDAFANKLRVSVPRGNGPDLFIFAHDQVGDWAETGLIEPLGSQITVTQLDKFLPETLPGLVYDGVLYGLPLAYKTLALYYDQTLVPTAPETTDEMIAIATRIRDRLPGHWGIGYPIDSFYYHAPWLHGFGAGVIDEKGQFDINTAAMGKSLNFVRRLVTGGLMPKDAASAQITALFKQRKLAFVIDGPWFAGGLSTHTRWGVAPLPVMSETGKPARPYLGIEALMISAHSRFKDEALLVARFLTSDGEASQRWVHARQLVANGAVYSGKVMADDPFVKAFRTQLSRTETLSNVPAVRQMWSPLDRLLSQVVIRGAAYVTAIKEAELAIRRVSQ
jgi:arabinogalactan oligomer/maltooligosaccharide transport system substrate-binding protein